MSEPTIGMPVKLKKGILTLSARQIQHIKAVKKLRVNDHLHLSQEEVDGEGGYWVKTTHTNGEWWAWVLFRVA
jgi:16S rRNA U1498 N3-methylase RsmE